MNTYNKHLKYNARRLRNESTPGEAILWKHVLRAKQFFGLQFNRQFIIENYIVDFVCRKLKLVLELDGQYHDQITEKDESRDLRLKELGYTVIRIPEKLVMEDVNAVYHYLKTFIPEEIKRSYNEK
ncbi:endonuclease domain-containing protein [Roseivirga pacifica]|tara:strand:+ start:1003 stop:1380 length:378 start_codon:yes stop_codon:yes gene_type:complete